MDRQTINNSFNNSLPPWGKEDPHYSRLAQLDAILDGEYYDCLPHSFHQEEDAQKQYIPISRRRPSFRFNLFNMLADQLARKLFAGRHAPWLVHEQEKIKKQFDALNAEAQLESKMIEAVHWGSTGSVCSVFQLVPFKDNLTKVVVTNYRSKDCTPTFNKLRELSRLRVHYTVRGFEFLNMETPVRVDWEDKDIDPEKSYWYIQEWTAQKELVYKPIPEQDWCPAKVFSDKLILLEETGHGLGFVPAHWHQYRTATKKDSRPADGRCYWEPGVDCIIDLDYTISQIGSGIRYNAVPQVVVKGDVINRDKDGALGRGASRWIQIAPDEKESDGTESKNGNVFMLEARGDGMKVGLEFWAALVIRLTLMMICASQKDPNKMTTAMSGKGMEILESEFLDLAQELRNTFGEDGYLKLLKKIGYACVLKKHVLFKDVTVEQVDGLALGWPPLASIGMAEFQQMATALQMLVEAHIMEQKNATNFCMSQLDMPATSANRDYLPSVQSGEEPPRAPKEPSDQEDDEKNEVNHLASIMTNAAMQAVARGPLDTTPPIP